MNLYLVRHGESVSPNQNPEQPLSQEGVQQTKHVANLLKSKAVEIDELIHSVKLRAKQTAQILAETVAPELTLIQREGLKPMDLIEPILEEIHLFDRNVMIVGHLPFMENLLKALLKQEKSPVEFCGSCVVCLTKEKRSWQIAWTATPQMVSL